MKDNPKPEWERLIEKVIEADKRFWNKVGLMIKLFLLCYNIHTGQTTSPLWFFKKTRGIK